MLTRADSHIMARGKAVPASSIEGLPSFRKPRSTWDSARDRFLCRYLVKIKQNGKQSDNGFKTQVWKSLQTAFNAKFKIELEITQIQTRMQSVLFFIILN